MSTSSPSWSSTSHPQSYSKSPTPVIIGAIIGAIIGSFLIIVGLLFLNRFRLQRRQRQLQDTLSSARGINAGTPRFDVKAPPNVFDTVQALGTSTWLEPSGDHWAGEKGYGAGTGSKPKEMSL